LCGPLAAALIVVLALAAAPAVQAAAADSLRETPVVKAVRKASPAVVNISSAYEVRSRPNPFSGFGNPFFDEFFKDFFDPRFQRRQQQTSLGSGVIIDGSRGLSSPTPTSSSARARSRSCCRTSVSSRPA